MTTEKLYYQDAFLTDFTARVLSCQPDRGRWAVALDRTAFYPEGGGQGADHGVLGGVSVLDVREGPEGIVHLCDASLDVGAEVSGHIDWGRRFDHMQQHSGEHILSGILCDLYHCDNVGFHLGADTVTIDYNVPITPEQAAEAERRANAVLWADPAVEIRFPSRAELETLRYRSKKALTGEVRIVAVPGADCCACCGTHVRSAGQVGVIKILSCQKFREGVRMEILCGKRAYDYLSAVWEQDRAVGQALSVKPLDTLRAVERLRQETEGEKARIAALEGELFQSIAQAHAGAGDTLLIREPMRPDSVRRLADALARTCGGCAAVFAGQDGAGYTYALVRETGTVEVKALNAALRGRGGGRGGFAQGSVQADRREIEAFFQSVFG